MCGIFGVLDGARPIDLDLIGRANRLLKHRGPDDEGYLLADWRSGAVCSYGGADSQASLQLPELRSVRDSTACLVFAHRRLSIIDVSPAGHQPMASGDGRLWITYNGEIYNYLELRTELASRGHIFKTASDTEVILAAYEAWGARALERFVGMFAFAIVDLKRKTLFIARDPFGIKPLYYAVTPGGLAFASEIQPLLECAGVSRRANPGRVHAYLRFGTTDHGSETMFADVLQLPAAHYLTVDLAHSGNIPSPTRYWDIATGDRTQATLGQAAEQLQELFNDSVRLHLRSDVPVGACLSGGIDSSAIVCAMRRIGGPSLELNTLSYVADDPALDEEHWADLAGAAASSAMHKVRISSAELVVDIDRLIAVQGEPFGSTSIYAQYRVFRLASESGLKVMLDGQGADELFLGYSEFFNVRVAALLQRGLMKQALSFARRASQSGPSYLSVLLNAAGRLSPRRLQPGLMKFTGRPVEPDWINPIWFRRQGVSPAVPDWPRGQELQRQEARRALMETSLPALLRYEDRNSMAFSVESRVPFVTPALASFVFSLPDEYLLSSSAVTKSVLRMSLRGLVPDAILDRRDKVGFETPETTWLANLRPHIEHVLDFDSVKQIPALNPAAVRSAVTASFGRGGVHTKRLWAWYNLVRWADVFDVEFAA